MAEFDQTDMVHVLPRARGVERVDELVRLARGRRTVHIGFADRGCRAMQERSGTWLHAHLADAAASLVGLDLDADGVHEAVAAGFEAYVVDCTDPAAVAALGLEPAELVLAGEVIEHLDAPGGLFDAARTLLAPGGRLVVTTPNAYGWINVAASLGRREVNHPDHVALFTWRTLAALAERHGYEVVDTCVYVPALKQTTTASPGSGGAAALAARVVVGAERLAVRLGHAYAADGLIVTFRPT